MTDVRFMGALDPGDAVLSEDGLTVTIDRRPRSALGAPALAAIISAAGPEIGAALRAGAEAADARPVPEGPFGPQKRSARRFVTTEMPWDACFAGSGLEDAFREWAPKAATQARDAGIEGACIEAWSLPVTDFSRPAAFPFLLTPVLEGDADA